VLSTKQLLYQRSLYLSPLVLEQGFNTFLFNSR